MLIVFQILFFLFSLLIIVSVIHRFRAGELGPRGALFWVLFWVAATVAVFVPDSTTRLAHLLGIGRGTDFVLYIAIATIFFLLFRLHVKIESMGRDITKVIRKEAIDTVVSKQKREASVE